MRIYTSESPASEPYILSEDIDFPDWIERDCFVEGRVHLDEDEIVWVSSIKDLCRGGCASGCYMPAVTYRTAVETMSEHGDEVLSFIFDLLGEIPTESEEASSFTWSALACYYLSMAVELWAHGLMAEIEEAEEVEVEDA